MKKNTILLIAILAYTYGQAQCTFMFAPMSYTQITSNTTLNATGTNYWICSGLTVTINSSLGDNYICENNVTLNIINSDGDNVYAKPGCIINNSSSQAISVICDPSTVTLNNTGSGTIVVTQTCVPVIYDYTLIGGSGTCALIAGVEENESNAMSLFPNPFSTQTTLQIDQSFKNASLTVYNLFGQIVKQIDNISGETIIFHRDDLPSGLYLVRLTEKNKTIAVDKLVITDK
jgi:hypothetical protein